MIELLLDHAGGRPLRVVLLGAHPDDIEIGAGGTLLTLAETRPGLVVHYQVMTGTAGRHEEARAAATAFLPGARVTLRLLDLPDGRLPAAWSSVKDSLEEVAATMTPDLVIAPSPMDAHQDHRTVGELVATVFRNSLCLAYEIPKWDGDLGAVRPSLYLPMSSEVARRKVELLSACFPSQKSRDWWDDEVFLGLARLRGMESRTRYAEAFTCTKAVLRC
ncbi:MAG: PIG-L family deacetylase [Actinomycetota bacterium]|nr:PIG-L family deacetylase [Actinomycetota bacterium]